MVLSRNNMSFLKKRLSLQVEQYFQSHLLLKILPIQLLLLVINFLSHPCSVPSFHTIFSRSTECVTTASAMSSTKTTSTTMSLVLTHVSLEVLMSQIAGKIPIFLLTEILETPQIQRLNGNHSISNTICSSCVPNLIFKNLQIKKKNLRSLFLLLPLLSPLYLFTSLYNLYY